MIPILYEEGTTDFSNNGIGRLSACISCTVNEKESGVYECQFKYPMTGIHYDDIKEGRIIYCTHDDTKTKQPFVIYKRLAPHNGVVTFYAHHVTYGLGNVILNPFEATTCAEALLEMKQKEINASPFAYWTDKTASGDFEIKVPTVARSILAGVQGSILDVFGGGDYEWDHYTVKLYADRGEDNNVNIRYGVNMLSMTQDADDSSTFNAVAPFWFHAAADDNDSDILITIPEKIVRASSATSRNLRPITLDLSDKWNSPPTIQQLTDYAVAYMNQKTSWKMSESVTVNFIALWQTDDYKDVAPLQRVRLYDYVHVIHDELGVNKKLQVTETEYNVLTERYDRMVLGASKPSFAQVISGVVENNIMQEVPTKSYVDQAIALTAATIKGNRGGYKLEITDADGHTMETLYMDAPNVEDAVHILRIGMSGIAFSDHGYDPEYFVSAWDINGNFNANFISSGVINANLIRSGIISDLAGKNYWNLETGEFSLQVVSGDPIDQAIQRAAATAGGYTLETPFTWSSDRKTANFTAIVYEGKFDVTSRFPSSWFVWTLRTEDGETQLGTGPTLSVSKSLFGFGATVTCTFTTYETAALRSVQGAKMKSMAGKQMLMYAAQNTDIIISDLPVKTASTIALTDKLLGLDNVEGFQISISDFISGVLDARYVNVSGDTMTGNLTVNKASPQTLYRSTNINSVVGETIPSSGETMIGGIQLVDNQGYNCGWFRHYKSAADNTYAQMCIRRKVNGADLTNALTLMIRADGTRSVVFSESAVWREALNVVNKSGDTLTGSLGAKFSTFDLSKANNGVSATQYPTTFSILDTASRIAARQEAIIYADGNVRSYWYVRNYDTSGEAVGQKGLWMQMDKSGNLTWSVSDSANFRNAINAVNKSGDTMTGGLTVQRNSDPYFATKNPDINAKIGQTIPSATTTIGRHIILDSTGTSCGWMTTYKTAADLVYTAITTRRYNTSGTMLENYITLGINASGGFTVGVATPSAWRTAIGAAPADTAAVTLSNYHANIVSGTNSTTAIRRHGIIVIKVIFQLKAGTYTNTDVLFKVSPAPAVEARAVVTGNGAQPIRILTSGECRFNNTSTTFSSNTYLLGQIVYAY